MSRLAAELIASLLRYPPSTRTPRSAAELLLHRQRFPCPAPPEPPEPAEVAVEVREKPRPKAKSRSGRLEMLGEENSAIDGHVGMRDLVSGAVEEPWGEVSRVGRESSCCSAVRGGMLGNMLGERWEVCDLLRGGSSRVQYQFLYCSWVTSGSVSSLESLAPCNKHPIVLATTGGWSQVLISHMTSGRRSDEVFIARALGLRLVTEVDHQVCESEVVLCSTRSSPIPSLQQ